MVIPDVMNANLSLMSNSGDELNVGQVVYYSPKGKKGKREMLFVVNENWKNDTILEIDAIIKEKVKKVN